MSSFEQLPSQSPIEEQFMSLLTEAVTKGTPIHNARTGKATYTLPPRCLYWDLGATETEEGFDIGFCTTRTLKPKAMLAEIIGYHRGYDNIRQFEALGTRTLNANATKDPAWLNNPHRKGDGDIGHTYGVVGRNYPSRTHGTIDLVEKVITNLRNGIDDRAEIISWLDLGNFDRAMLRPCMHTYNYSLVDGRLNVVVYQRSCDIALGGRFNMPQINSTLIAMAAMTGNRVGTVHWMITNPHVYEDQMEVAREEIKRAPNAPIRVQLFTPETFYRLTPKEAWDHIYPSDFNFVGLEELQSTDALNYPFTTAANEQG